MTRMDELTQTQIILLTLLVSFITSIATGIITASLLAEAPIGVTQTINRVVERTIEKVIPETIVTEGGETIIKEVTVIKEEDAVTSAIEKTAKSVVRIYSPTLNNERQGEFYGLGLIISAEGLVVSDLRNVNSKEQYTITLSDGAVVDARAVDVGVANNVAIFKISPTSTKDSFAPITLSPNEPKLGQSVIAIQGENKNNLALGRVLSIETKIEKTPEGEEIKVAESVTTDIGLVGEIAGSALLNLSGELIGIKTSNSDLSLAKGVYTTVISINRAISRVK